MSRRNQTTHNPAIALVNLFWLLWGIVAGMLVVLDQFTSFQLGVAAQTTLLLSAIAAFFLFGTLFNRWACSRLAAVIYHVYLGLVVLLVLVFTFPYTHIVDQIPMIGNVIIGHSSLSALLALILFSTAMASFAAARYLELPQTWSAFQRSPVPQRIRVCDRCGATRATQSRGGACPHCSQLSSAPYFLLPVAPAGFLPSVPLLFERGEEEIGIGRGVKRSEGRLYLEDSPSYYEISRFHAKISYSFIDKQLKLKRDKTSGTIMVNGENVSQSKRVQVGDVIQLAGVEFVLCQPNYPIAMAYWEPLDHNDGGRKLLTFHKAENDRAMGRADECDVLLESLSISRHHASLVYDFETSEYILVNTSEGNKVTVNGLPVDEGYSELFPRSEPARIALNDLSFFLRPLPILP